MSLSKLNIPSVCSYFHIVCTLFLFCCIPFYYSIFTQYALIFFFSSFVIDYIASKRWKEGFKWNYSRVISVFLLLQIGLLFIFSLFEQEPRYLSTLYEYRMSFLGFGIVGLLGVSNKFKVRYFAYSTIIAVIVLLISLYNVIPDWFDNLVTLNEKLKIIRHLRGINICSHMTINIFFCVGMALFAKLFTISHKAVEKVFCVLMIVLYYIFVMLSEGRMGMLNASLLLGFILLRSCLNKVRFLLPLFIILAMMVASGVYYVYTNDAIKSNISVLNKTNPREFIWKEAVNKIKKSPIIGVGASTNAAEFKDILLKNQDLIKTERFLLSHLEKDHVYGMHPHNQIMQSWQEYGIIGLFAILGLFVSIAFAVRGSLTLSLIFSVLFIQLLSEVIDGGITTIGFCTYVYLILVLLESKQMGKEKVGCPKRISCTPCNA